MKEIGLKDLNKKSMKEVNISSFKSDEAQEKKENDNPILSSAMNGLDSLVSRVKETVDDAVEFKENMILETELDEDIDETDRDSVEYELLEEDEVVKPESKKKSKEVKEKKNLNIVVKQEEDEVELDIDDEDEEDEELKALSFKKDDDRDKQLLSIKEEIKSVIKPFSNKIDLSSFTISKKPMSLNNALKRNINANKSMDWGLYHSQMTTAMKEFTADDITTIATNTENKNRLNGITDTFTLLFDHLTSKKPKTMEEWVKLVKFYDYDHIFFNAYKSSFQGANYIPCDCPHCKDIFISDDIRMEDMVKYLNDETKVNFKELLEKDSNDNNDRVDVELKQITDNYVVGFRDPSIYNVLFETSVLPTSIIQKYKNLIEIISYIEDIYIIDYDNNTFIPIEIPHEPHNMPLNVKNKIVRYGRILKTLNSDQLGEVEKIINQLEKKSDDITYIIPKVTCKKCGKDIPEKDIAAQDLLFTRHQLTRIANS